MISDAVFKAQFNGHTYATLEGLIYIFGNDLRHKHLLRDWKRRGLLDSLEPEKPGTFRIGRINWYRLDLVQGAEHLTRNRTRPRAATP
jgi:hypothetical protein